MCAADDGGDAYWYLSMASRDERAMTRTKSRRNRWRRCMVVVVVVGSKDDGDGLT